MREPIFNVPGAVLALLAIFLAVHGGRQLLPDDLDTWLTLTLAFIPARWGPLAGELPGGHVAAYTSVLTHMLVHGDWAHLALNSGWLLAFGAALERRVGALRLIGFAIVTGLAGIGLYVLFHWRELAPVVGASGAVSGLMGGALRLMPSLQAMRTGLPGAGGTAELRSVLETLRDRQMQVLMGVWFVLNLVLGLLGSYVAPGSGGIAWEAHVGGFVAGILLLGPFDRAPPARDLPDVDAEPDPPPGATLH